MVVYYSSAGPRGTLVLALQLCAANRDLRFSARARAVA